MKLSSFLSNNRGNATIVFALGVIPLFLASGAAIDYSRAIAKRQKLQAAVEGAALAAAAAKGLTNAQRIERAKKAFAANTADFEGTASANFQIVNTTVVGTANYQTKTAFMRIAGIDTMDISALAKVKERVEGKGEIALVLDYSGSMGWRGKWQAMRDAAVRMVDDLTEQGTNKDVKFALVPFSGQVRVTLPKKYVVGKRGNGNWTGCMQDRKYPYNRQDTTPTSRNVTKFGWSDYGNANTSSYDCTRMARNNLFTRTLSNNHSATKAHIKAMRPHAMTHIAVGLETGWHVISPNEPFGGSAPYNDKDTVKAIVLLTDGDQTSRAWGPGNRYRGRSVYWGEKNLEAMCTAIKNKGVLLITVAFDLRSASTKKRLKNCATSPAHFFDAATNSNLASAFDAIGGLIGREIYVAR